MSIRRAWVSILTLAIVLGCAFTVLGKSVVYFRNGRVLQVTAHETQGDWIFLLIDDQGEVQVPASQILRIEAFDANGRLLPPGDKTNLVKARARAQRVQRASSPEAGGITMSEEEEEIPQDVLERIQAQEKRNEANRNRVGNQDIVELLKSTENMTDEEKKKVWEKVNEMMMNRFHRVAGARRSQ